MKIYDIVDGKTKILGLIGSPITHTLSPVMHNAAFKHLGLNYIYIPIAVSDDGLDSFIKCFRFTSNFIGFNVTIPYKEKIVRYLDRMDKIVRYIGAVNTIVKKGDMICGYNTDVYGFLSPLKRFNLRGKKAVLFGAGGAGRAIVFGLATKGIADIYIYDIVAQRVKNLIRDIYKYKSETRLHEFLPEDLHKLKKNIDILINATPVGMHDGDKSLVDEGMLCEGMIVYDIVYNRKTELLKLADNVKAIPISGVEMFVNQGGKSFQIWTKMKPPIKVMLKSIKRFIG